MRTIGPYALLQRLELGHSTESWIAPGPLRVTAVLASMQNQRWVDAQLERARAGAGLPDPWPRVRFVGREAGEAVEVQEYRGGVPLFQVLRGTRLPPSVAVRLAIDLCDALTAAVALPTPAQGLDDVQLAVGWDGAIQVGGFSLDRPETLPGPEQLEPVFRIALVLSRMLAGHPATHVPRAPVLELWPGQLAPHQGVEGIPDELARIVEKNLGPARAPTCAALARALEPHAAPRDDAHRFLADHLRPRFAFERAIDLARLGLCGVDLEPLPNDHVAKVYGGRDDEGDWLVLGDWFQGTSHPRGQLIGLQMRDNTGLEVGHLIEHSPELRVPHKGPGLTLAWRWGYVERATLFDLESADALALILAHPSMRFLEELIIERGDEERIAMLLPGVKPPPTLTVLRLPRRTRAVVEAVKAAWPRIKRVERAVPARAR